MEVMAEVAQRLVAAAAIATAGAPNEASLRQELESSLRQSSEVLGISWTPFRLDLTLRTDRRAIYADVAHGAVVIDTNHHALSTARREQYSRMRGTNQHHIFRNVEVEAPLY